MTANDGERGSRDAGYFDRIYAADPDPWRFTSSPYEREKYADTLDALAGPRFGRALEVGCSIGVLTERLAAQCDALLAVDISETPLLQARARCRDQPHVAFRRMAVPAEWPEGSFDLIVLSEVLYFLSPDDVARVARHVLDSLAAAGRVLLVDWLGHADNPCTGEQAAELFIAECGGAARAILARRTQAYRLDVLLRGAAPD
jgi:SAM-dependent methyltransferase